MICIAINSKSSFDGIDRWRDEIKEVEPNKDIILVLTKCDIADDFNPDELVTFDSVLAKKRAGGF